MLWKRRGARLPLILTKSRCVELEIAFLKMKLTLFFQKTHSEELEAEREKAKEAIAAALEEERKRSKVSSNCTNFHVLKLSNMLVSM